MKHGRCSIRKGDQVQVIAGRDRGKRGKVLRVLRKAERVLVEGVNFVKRHTKPSQQARQGGILEKEAPIHVSNVLLLDPSTGKAARAGTRLLADGAKVRIARPSGETIDV